MSTPATRGRAGSRCSPSGARCCARRIAGTSRSSCRTTWPRRVAGCSTVP